MLNNSDNSTFLILTYSAMCKNIYFEIVLKPKIAEYFNNFNIKTTDISYYFSLISSFFNTYKNIALMNVFYQKLTTNNIKNRNLKLSTIDVKSLFSENGGWIKSYSIESNTILKLLTKDMQIYFSPLVNLSVIFKQNCVISLFGKVFIEPLYDLSLNIDGSVQISRNDYKFSFSGFDNVLIRLLNNNIQIFNIDEENRPTNILISLPNATCQLMQFYNLYLLKQITNKNTIIKFYNKSENVTSDNYFKICNFKSFENVFIHPILLNNYFVIIVTYIMDNKLIQTKIKWKNPNGDISFNGEKIIINNQTFNCTNEIVITD